MRLARLHLRPLGGLLADVPAEASRPAARIPGLARLEASAEGVARFERTPPRIEADTASGFIVTAVEGLAAEHYRRVISEKTRDALARLRAQGRRVSGRPPYGWRFAADGRTLEPEPGEEAALRAMRRLAPGRSLRALARQLAARGIVSRAGRPFDAKTLWRLVADRTVSHRRAARSAA